RPLREPRPQRREAADADRASVGGFGLAEVAPERLAVIRVDRRIHEAQIRHGAIGDEAPLDLVATAALERRQRLLHKRRAPAHALELRGAEARDELLLVRRP